MQHFVYVMTSKPRGTLYIGCTKDLVRRVHEHRLKAVPGFTAQYDLTRLVHFEAFDDYEHARQRERRLKKWLRAWKIALIEESNSEWRDLFEDIANR